MEKQNKEQPNKNTQPISQKPRSDSSPPAITVDYEKYAHFLDSSDLSEEQKHQFMGSMWLIACEFIALGFRVHPVQQAEKACGKATKISEGAESAQQDAVHSLSQFIEQNYADFSGPEADRNVEGVE